MKKRFAMWTVALTLAACRPTGGEAPPAATPGSGSGAAAPAGYARTDDDTSRGLVGPGAAVEKALPVTDVGPPAPTLLFTAGIKGYTEPCGCTTDLLLGGIDRVTGWVGAAAALAPEAIVVDAGNLLYEFDSVEPGKVAQEQRKTEVILAAQRRMGAIVTTIGPTDLALGLDDYLARVGATPIHLLTSNLTATGGGPIGLPFHVAPFGGTTVAFVGAIDPELVAGRADVEASPPLDAVTRAASGAREAGATVVLLLWQGDLASARRHLSTVEGVDFLVIGNGPRETDEVLRVGSAWTLEAWDQGRHIGRLKLYGLDRTGTFQNARGASAAEIERLERLIAGLEAQLATIPDGSGVENPIVTTQRERLADYRNRLDAAQSGGIDIPAEGRAFLHLPEPMKPGYATDPEISEAMRRYNAALREINLASAALPPPVAEGQAHYVGDVACATCHAAEHAQWKTTRHANAIETLRYRDKEYDQSCIGCHVTGYERPGGSSLAKLDGLVNVQCEQCHGPGSEHARDPTKRGGPDGVVRLVSEATCLECHKPEHSPRFDYPTWLPKVLGPGHGHP